ncbi:hypothetical protein ACVWYH_010425 [Bradyrhizobium sp. GM24.11]
MKVYLVAVNLRESAIADALDGILTPGMRKHAGGPRDRRLLLARMEVAQAETQRHLGVIERQIAARAERLTITDRAKRRQHGRSASSWTNADERLFQQHVAELALARRGEIDALTRKLDWQETAIAQVRTDLRASAASR